MTQLVHSDGSQSETVIEVKLRHPGKNDRNSTRNHNWQIYVNPVGVDAAVKPTITRCVAGGYVWNPYYTQLADPLNVSFTYFKYNDFVVVTFFHLVGSIWTRVWPG